MAINYNLFKKPLSVIMAILVLFASASPTIAVVSDEFLTSAELSSVQEIKPDEQTLDLGEENLPDEENELVGEIITLDNGLRIQMNADEKSYTVVAYIGGKSEVDIPEEYLGLPITRIGDVVFYGNQKVRKITIPDTVSFVGEHTFANLSAEFEYNTTNGGRYLGNENNPYLYFVAPIDENATEITVHEDTVIVGSYAFANCKNLKKVVIGKNVVSIGYAAMGKDSCIEDLTIPFFGGVGYGDSNRHLGYIFGARTYGGNISYVPLTLSSLAVTETATKMQVLIETDNGNDAVYKSMPTTVTQRSLYGVDMLTSLTLPYLGASLADSSKGYISYPYGGTGYSDNITPQTLKNLTILNGVIGDNAVNGTIYLESVALGDGVTSIGDSAFSGCTGLTSVKIGNGVTSIGDSPFSDCTNLTSVYISSVEAWCNIDFVDVPSNPLIYAKNLYLNDDLVTDLIIPEGTTVIKDYAFYWCTSLTSVTIPDSVTSIGECAFYYCKSLTSATIGNGVTTIGDYAFYNCSSLASVTIGNSVTSIRSYAFYWCLDLTSITIPKSITSIGYSAFEVCRSLTSAYYDGTESEWYANVFVHDRNRELTNVLIFAEDSSVVSLSIANEAAVNGNESEVKPLSLSASSSNTVNYSEGLDYISNGNGTCYVSGIGTYTDSNLVIPSVSPDGDTVTSIGNSAFSGCTSLTGITIPNSVKSIGSYAFKDCTGLTNVTIGNSVSSIGNSAFRGCTSLTSVKMPDSVIWIGDLAFYYCTGLTSVKIGTSVNSIGSSAFQGCKSLTNVTIPDSVTSIETSAFDNCTSLTSVTIPSGISSIESTVFSGCTSLTSVTIPASVTSMGRSAFYNCTSLTSVYITDLGAWLNIAFVTDSSNPLYYGENLYLNGELVTDLIIPEGTAGIRGYAFSNCTSLTSVTIPNSVTYIGYYAFYGCSSLTSVTIPDSVTSIGSCAFYNCTGLTDVTIGNSVTAINSYAFYGCTGLTNATIGNSVTTIGDYAFYNCMSLTSAAIPDSVTSIGYSSFHSCANLAIVTIGNSVTSIGRSAFSNCTSLTSIIIPDSVTAIGNSAFYNCASLTSATIGSCVTTIGDYAFYGCTELPSVTIGNSITSIGIDAFYNCTSLTSVCISDIGAWCNIDFARYSSNPLYYGKKLYLNGELVTDLIIPEGTTAIKDYAFYNCASLTSVTLPNSLNTLGSNVFYGCSSLTRLNYNGDSYEWRHVRKQTDWNNGTTITEPIYLKKFNGLLYDADDNMDNFWVSGFRLPEGGNGVADIPELYSGRPVTLIYDNAFDGCTNITEITIPESVKKIGMYAFRNCSSLTHIRFPNSITEIEKGILQGCTSLQSLDLSYLGKTPEYDYKFESGSEEAVYGGEYLGYYFGAASYKEHNVMIPRSLEVITIRHGEQLAPYCFYECENLKAINLPDELTTINDRAFSNCLGLASFSFPDSVTTVGLGILENCHNIKTIEIGSGLSYIQDALIASPALMMPLFGIDKSRSSLEAYKVSEENAEYYADERGILYRYLLVDGAKVPVAVVDAPAKVDLENYSMPETIVDIYAYAFAYNSTLQSIDLNYVRRIANHAFYQADRLVYVSLIGGDDASLGESLGTALDSEYSSDLTYYQTIGDSAFMGCSSLVSVEVLANNILKIGSYAFSDCSELRTVKIGKNVQKIGLAAFGATASGESNIQQFIVDSENVHYKSIDGVLYSVNTDGDLTLEIFPAMLIALDEDNKPVTVNGRVQYVTEFAVPDGVSAIQSYAFRGSKELLSITVAPQNEIVVGDYAFSESGIQNVIVGEMVTSLGLIRGESEYTVFSDMEYLTSITVDEGNRFYSSQNDVLFDKEKAKLIKYPTSKATVSYAMPDTVKIISSMAFKNNRNLINITVSSNLSVIGLEAFYACGNLGMIYFYRCYAPLSILENAFTTKVEIEGNVLSDPRTVLGYNAEYYSDGANGEAGWNRYDGVYNIELCTSAPDIVTVDPADPYYAIVVVDSKGSRLGNFTVSLTDPNGLTEVVKTGNSNLGNGIAVFFDLYGTENVGFSLEYDSPYILKITDDQGNYMTFYNPTLYLDGDMYITYVTMTKQPSVYGLNCDGQDMNTQRVEINKAEYGYMGYVLDEETLGFATDSSGNPIETYYEESVEISVIGYCDVNSGYSFDTSKCGIYQNNVKVAEVLRAEIDGDATIFYFDLPINDALACEVDLEARLVASCEGADDLACKTGLNIFVFDFEITSDDIDLDMSDVTVDLHNAGSDMLKLLGVNSVEIELNKNLDFRITPDKDTVTIQLEYEKKGKPKEAGDPKTGYNSNKSSKYRFKFNYLFVDTLGDVHDFTYLIHFARGTEDSDFYYYHCYVYEGNTKATGTKIDEFYGVVNAPLAAPNLREGAKMKARVVALYHYAGVLRAEKDAYSNAQAFLPSDIKDIDQSDFSTIYKEVIVGRPEIGKDDMKGRATWKLNIMGEIKLQYEGGFSYKPISSRIVGSIEATYTFNGQYVVWVIPVTLEIKVAANGSVEIILDFDENRTISLEEVEATINVQVDAKLGIGCRAISGGIYGNIGMAFVLDILPDFQVESLRVYGEMGAYVRVLFFEKKFRLTPDSWADGYYIINNSSSSDGDGELQSSRTALNAAVYLADGYEAASPEALRDSYKLVVIGDELYKICYADVSGISNYDEYNYVKLALCKWDKEKSDWTEPVIVDDNGFMDTAYTLYQSNGKVFMAYTQQTKKMTAETIDDTYAAAEDTCIKLVELSDNVLAGNASVNNGFLRDNYAYLAQYAVIDGIPTLVWAENTDNNIFGVSPYNYIDSNGNSNIFQTTANSVWFSQYSDEGWSEPQQVASGLSAVTQLAVGDHGNIAYIVDTNGDLSDTDDRIMYRCSIGGTPEAFNSIEKGSVIAVYVTEEGFNYYYDEVYKEDSIEADGWYNSITVVGSASVSLPDNAPIEFEVLTDEDNTLKGIAYIKNKTWTESDKQITGSALYAIWYEDGAWGQPVEISEYIPVADRYIQHYTAVLSDEQLIAMLTTTDSNGENAETLKVVSPLKKKITVIDYSVDYRTSEVEITVANSGSFAAPIYISIDGSSFALFKENLRSGESSTLTVPITNNKNATHVIAVSHNQNGTDAQSIKGICLNYSDLQPFAKLLHMSGLVEDNGELTSVNKDVLLVAVKNTGCIDDVALTVIKVGAYKATAIITDEILAKIDDLVLADGQMQFVELENGDGFWVVKDSVKAGAIVHHEIELSQLSTLADGELIGIYTVSAEAVENEECQDNNFVFLTYSECEGVLAEDESISADTAITQSIIVFDPMLDNDNAELKDVCVDYTSAYGVGIDRITIGDTALSENDYSVTEYPAGGRITVKASLLKNMAADEYTFTVHLKDGTNISTLLKIVKYFEVKWNDGTNDIESHKVKEGTLPRFDGIVTKNSEVDYTYRHSGWDVDRDGKADVISVVTDDVTYYAVWTEETRFYTVTWKFTDIYGNMVSVDEQYAYSTSVIPTYSGKIPCPAGKEFAGWNTEPEAVTGDATYEALYRDIRIPVEISIDNIGSANSGATVIAPTAGWFTGGNTFTIESELLCYVFVSTDGGNTYVRVEADTESGNVRSYTIENLSADTRITVSVAGDMNGDGLLNNKDLGVLQQYLNGWQVELNIVAADINADGELNNKDYALLQRYLNAWDVSFK